MGTGSDQVKETFSRHENQERRMIISKNLKGVNIADTKQSCIDDAEVHGIVTKNPDGQSTSGAHSDTEEDQDGVSDNNVNLTDINKPVKNPVEAKSEENNHDKNISED